MNKIDIKGNLEYLTKLVPILTILTLIYGYIGFHTYVIIYNIPIVTTDISIIAGIGLLNMTYLCILYLAAPTKRTPTFLETLIIYIVFVIVLYSPIKLAYLLAFYFMMNSLPIIKKKKKISFNRLRRKVSNYRSALIVIDGVILIAAFVLAFFTNYFTMLLMVLYGIVYTFHKYKNDTLKPSIFHYVYILIFPVFTMYFFIKSSNTNILGLNRQEALVITEKDTLKTEIVFSDNNYYYCSLIEKNKKLLAINKNDIKRIITFPDTTDDDKVSPWKLIQKSLFKKH